MKNSCFVIIIVFPCWCPSLLSALADDISILVCVAPDNVLPALGKPLFVHTSRLPQTRGCSLPNENACNFIDLATSGLNRSSYIIILSGKTFYSFFFRLPFHTNGKASLCSKYWGGALFHIRKTPQLISERRTAKPFVCSIKALSFSFVIPHPTDWNQFIYLFAQIVKRISKLKSVKSIMFFQHSGLKSLKSIMFCLRSNKVTRLCTFIHQSLDGLHCY